MSRFWTTHQSASKRLTLVTMTLNFPKSWKRPRGLRLLKMGLACRATAPPGSGGLSRGARTEGFCEDPAGLLGARGRGARAHNEISKGERQKASTLRRQK